MAWFGFILDAALIVMVGVGVVHAVRLIRQLKELKESRAEMDTFVHDFNNAVIRAETGIKTLRMTARESGDDLEKLVDKAGLIRDELTFITESADSVADRLATMAAKAMRPDVEKAEASADAEGANLTAKRTVELAKAKIKAKKAAATKADAAHASRAEEELMQALKKLG